MDLCNDLNYIIIFVIGFGITAADEHGMKEVIKKGRWYNLVVGNLYFYYIIYLYNIYITYYLLHISKYFL